MAAALQAVKRFRVRELAHILKANTIPAAVPVKARNPFAPFKNPDSGRWAPAKYSLRRQADLLKQARASGTLHLLPPGIKFSAAELRKAQEAHALAEKEVAPEGAEPLAEMKQEVVWEGAVKERKVKAPGSRLYAGRRKMFKGHKWERTAEKRKAERELALRTMGRRIKRFKSTYTKKRPSPIALPRNTSFTKLPF